MSTEKIPYKDVKPKNVDAEVWACVVEAWENGLSDNEASLIVSKQTGKMTKASDISAWRKNNPKVDELKAFLEVSLRAEAKLNISKALKGSEVKTSQIKTAEWYLERKASDEFSTKSAVAFEGAVIELSLEDKEKALKELVEKFDDGE